MWHTTLFITLFLALALLSAGSPVPISRFARDETITEAQVIQVAPTSKTCDNPPAEGECATASQAAKFTSQSFNDYKVTSRAEQAAILSLMAFESDDFKYNKNHFPGTPGQGSEFTPFQVHPGDVQSSVNHWHAYADGSQFLARNMQSPTYNKKYASSISALDDKIAKVADSPADLLDLLRDNKTWDFGSGAWFLTTQCSKDVRSALQTGSESGWQRYISECVGTTVTDQRTEYWQRAVKALAVS